jgi:malonyl-CoA/methylmalonyl-CoA synthetase
MFFDRLARADDRIALRCGSSSLSYADLARACAAHVARLKEHGLAPGDRVGVWTHPNLATCVALVAHASAGFVSVPLNTKIGAKELTHILGDAKPRVCVSSEDAPPPFVRAQISFDPAPPIDHVGVDHSPMLILYTSGTTGAPKGAVLSRRNVCFDLDALATAWRWTQDDEVVHALPLFHVHGLALGLFGALRTGGTLHLLPRFDPIELASALHDRSVLFAVPTMYHRLAELGSPEIRKGLRAARLLVSGSAGLPVREHERLAQLCERGVLERYGLTETLINTAVRADEGARPGSVGRALDGIELRLVDDSRKPIEGDAIGEVAVRGANVFSGYLDRPDATREVIDDAGYFYTGDLAMRSEDGSIRIVGRRATDLIKTGGFKVGAGEIEAALLEHADVAEAAVIGAPDDDLGERIVAFVVVRRPIDPNALRDHVAAQLSVHKRPREVHLVSELPRNAMGKVLKNELRKR